MNKLTVRETLMSSSRRFRSPWSIEDACFVVGPAPDLLPKSPRENGPVTFANLAALTRDRGELPMAMILLMIFLIGMALALGFLIGRVYRIRCDEVERRDGFQLPRTAHIPRP